MKKLLFILPLMFLVGCSITVPVKQKFPEVPKELMISCPQLQQVKSTEKLSDVLQVVTKNYSQYHECQIKTDAWIQWYNLQEQIYNK